MMDEVLDSEDNIAILRMLACMKDHFKSLAERAVPGMAPWRSGKSTAEPDIDENEQGPVYMGELKRMLENLIKYNQSEEVVKEARGLLERFGEESL